MRNNIIHNIEFNDIMERSYTFSNMVDYIDSDVIIAGSMSDVLDEYGVVRLNFWVIIYCMEGSVQLELENRTIVMQKDDLLMCMPLSIIGDVKLSRDHKIKIYGFSPTFLARVVKDAAINIDGFVGYVHETPLFHNVSNNTPQIFRKYNELIVMKLGEEAGYFRRQIISYLFSALFCEIMAAVSGCVSDKEKRQETKRAPLVFKRFIREVAKDDGSHRSVGYYADLLCYSPKYVSYVVKQVSGYTAMYWINKHVMEQVKFNLRHSDRSIKEIAMMFDFPNMSFFGKYVKRYLGVSPKAYRNMISENSTFVDTKTEKGDTAESGK